MRAAGLVLAGLLGGCPAPARPHVPAAAAVTLEIGRDAAVLRGVAGDADRLYAALATGGRTTVEARRGTSVVWKVDLDGTGGPLARGGDLLVATLGGAPAPGPGERGASIVGLAAASGQARWRVALSATRWLVVSAIAPVGVDGVVVGGSFGGTLRAGPAPAAGALPHVVTSAGEGDGFVARITGTGQVAWLVRLGGAGADAVQGVAAAADRVVLAGTFTAGADLLGETLTPYDERSPLADVFVAELDASGARRWQATFGGRENDTVAGVALDAHGRVAVAATARDVVRAGSADLVAQGAADGLVAWFSPEGEPGAAVLLGGPDFDGLRGIAAVGDRVIVGGFFSGSMPLAGRTLSAGGGDDAFLAIVNEAGAVTTGWQVGGDGREEIVALAPVPGGVIAGVAHTARAVVDGAREALPAPADPMAGAALVVRGVP